MNKLQREARQLFHMSMQHERPSPLARGAQSTIHHDTGHPLTGMSCTRLERTSRRCGLDIMYFPLSIFLLSLKTERRWESLARRLTQEGECAEEQTGMDL